MLKKTFIIFLLFIITILPVQASEKINFITQINQDFSVNNMPEIIEFKTIKKITLNNNIIIPQRSIIYTQAIESQKERRWHKSGYILCKITAYKTEQNEVFNIGDQNLYFIARKYEPVNKKEATILATEIVLTQAASFFAPGVDILYFFTKGAIKRENDFNWFKAGVSNAYENSICWFWLKGKSIDLIKDEQVILKDIEKEKVEELSEKISDRKWNQKLKTYEKNIHSDQSKKNEQILENLKEINTQKEEIHLTTEIKMNTKNNIEFQNPISKEQTEIVL